eukprot:Hpha_TRINITY_DN9934_c0_g2::TRINITY_DN9934_c0_g2_i1::g.140325::m.140325
MWCNTILGLLVRKGDTPEEVQTKKLAFPVCAGLFLLVAFSVAVDVAYGRNRNTYVVGASLCALGPAFFMTGVVFNVAKPGLLIDALLVINTIGLCVMDANAAALSSSFRPWCFGVLILDAALVFNRQHIPYFVIPVTLV